MRALPRKIIVDGYVLIVTNLATNYFAVDIDPVSVANHGESVTITLTALDTIEASTFKWYLRDSGGIADDDDDYIEELEEGETTTITVTMNTHIFITIEEEA